MTASRSGISGLAIGEILKLLPHRYPFLLVDRILKVIPGEDVVAIKNVTMNEPFFNGHFPDQPVMPGVLLLEALGQAGGILAFSSWPEGHREFPLLLSGADHVRFRRQVIPGDQVRLEVEIMKLKSRAARMRGVATVDGQRTAEAEFLAVLGDRAV